MCRKIFAGGTDGNFQEWEEIPLDSLVALGMFPPRSCYHEYLVLRRELPKPKEEKCPELQPGDVARLDTMPWAYLVVGTADFEDYAKALRMREGCLFNPCRIRRGGPNPVVELYRLGKKIWWTGKLEGGVA